MLKNVLKIAWRNLSRNKSYAIINITGLAIGISCCILIFEYVGYEKSYEDFNRNADRIVRVQDENFNSGVLVLPCAAAMPGIAPAMKREFPEVEEACRLAKSEFLLGNDSRDIKFRESSVYYADASVQQIFSLQLLSGDVNTALSGPGKVILSADEASKYFGNENPLGKILTVHGGRKLRPLQVTGIFKDYPDNSHVKLNVIVSYETYSQVTGFYGKPIDETETSFSWTNFYTYLLLREGTDQKQFAAKLPAFIDGHYNRLPANKAKGDSFSLSLMPLRNIHLDSHYTQEAEANGNRQSVNFLFVIALLIIVIAWINYTNLATARSLERAREVGVRKVLGAMRGELTRQFMMESLLLNILALIAASIITILVNPLFARMTGKSLPFFLSLSIDYKGYFLALLAAGIFLSGFYPALYLSRYQPVVVLKGAFKNTAGGQRLRKGLIVAQFAASIILIAGTIIVYRQLHYMQHTGVGADITNTLVLPGPGGGLTDSAYSDAFSSFKDDIFHVNGVKNITASSGVMGHEIFWSRNWHVMRGGANKAVNLFLLGVDNNFTGSYGLGIIAGQSFSKSPKANYRKVILNESAVAALGFISAKTAIGELISGGQSNIDSMQVCGVISDYHHEGLRKAIQPLVLLPDLRTREYYSVKIEGANEASIVSSIKRIWTSHFPADPYEYFFLDEFFNRQYAEDEHFGEVFGIFALLAIAIACFGLLGLSAYNVVQRSKEISVRKILGASVQNLLFTLSKDFLLLVIIALVIAVPVSWFAMSSWLQGFAYHITIGAWVFAVAGILAIFLALFTIYFQALKVIVASPVKSLREI